MKSGSPRVVAVCILLVAAGAGAAILAGASGTARIAGTLVVAALGLGLAWWSRRGPRGALGAVALVAGIVGVGVGIGRGLRHLTAGAPDPAAWTALVSLAAGLLLIGWAFAALLGGLRRPARIGAGIGLLIVTLLAVYTVSIPLMVVDPPRAAVTGTAPAGFAPVAFPAADGVQLQGWYRAGDNGAAVLVVPGSGSSRSGAVEQAAVLADAGYGVLVYDPRGHGDSAGQAMDLGWAGDADIRGAVDFLVGQGVESVGALGLSMGGEQVLGAAATDPRIAAVVAEGATHRTAADYDWLSEEFGWRGQLQKALNAPRFALVDALTPWSPPITLRQAVSEIAPRPVLIIAAGTVADEQLSAAVLTGEHVEVWVVPQAGHVGGVRAAPEAWRTRVTTFFAEALDS